MPARGHYRGDHAGRLERAVAQYLESKREGSGLTIDGLAARYGLQPAAVSRAVRARLGQP